MSDSVRFLQDDLYPALVQSMNTVFPDRKWTKHGYKWSSPYHLDGSASATGAKERTYINGKSKYPYTVGTTDDSGAMSLIDYSMAYFNTSYGETVKILADKLNLTCPEWDDKQYIAYKNQQDKILKYNQVFQKALFSPEGKDALHYLKETRGYSDGEIKAMGLGFISKAVANQINKEKLPLSYNPGKNAEIEKGDAKSLSPLVGNTHQLVIPYVSGGRLRGFKFRVANNDMPIINGKRVDKYINNTGLTKKSHLFGLSGLYLTGNGIKDRDLTIVEGELDALHAKACGIENIVAAAGGVISGEALAEVKKKGVERITILFDTEESEERNIKAHGKREAAVRETIKAGLYPLVAELPYEGGKQDVDSYLKGHSADELSNIIDNASPGVLWVCYYYIDYYHRSRQTSKDLDDLKNKVIDLSNTWGIKPTDRRGLFCALAKEIEAFSADSIEKEADQKRNEGEYITSLEDAIAGKLSHLDKMSHADMEGFMESSEVRDYVNILCRFGFREEVLSLTSKVVSIEKKLNSLKRIRKVIAEMEDSHDFSKFLDDDTDALFESYKNAPPVLQTDIVVANGFGNYRVTLPSAAITVVAAKTNHGKSKMLQHLALDAVKHAADNETVLYLTFEQSEKDVIKEMINCYAGLELTKETSMSSNRITIGHFLSTGETQYMKRDNITPFKRKFGEFKELLKSQKLKVIYPEDNQLPTLLDLIDFYVANSNRKIHAVFIDYIQELYEERNVDPRTEFLKKCMVQLDRSANKFNIPIIVAAQLKAEVQGPTTMSNEDIADSKWIGYKADQVMLVWSNKFHSYGGDVEKLDRKANELYPGLCMGEGGKLLLLVSKSRDIPTGTYAILEIAGNTGKIVGNHKEECRTNDIWEDRYEYSKSTTRII